MKNIHPVNPKKSLGQHFLNDENIAAQIVEGVSFHSGYKNLLEIGPGTGVLTKYLIENKEINLKVIELDRDSVAYLAKEYKELEGRIIEADFIKMDLKTVFNGSAFGIIGNFPYNISSQIMFKVLENKDLIPEVVGMFQKEVAERLAAPPGSKTYGILSVLLKAFYDVEYLFTVLEYVFTPPPKVKSGVIRVKRNDVKTLDCDEELFKVVVKTGFNQRRKTLRNALKSMTTGLDTSGAIFEKRAEQLSVADFVGLTNFLQGK